MLRAVYVGLFFAGVAGCRSDVPEASAADPQPSEESSDPFPTAILYPVPLPPAATIASLAARVYIRRTPSLGSSEIGVLHFGSVVELASEASKGHAGCRGGWLAVRPTGYVCQDETVTRDVTTHPVLRLLARHSGNFDAAAPYRWVESKGAPLYRVLPTPREQRRSEPGLDDYRARLERARSGGRPLPTVLADIDASPDAAAPPDFFHAGARSPLDALLYPKDSRPRRSIVPARSTVAVLHEVFAEDRSFWLTNDLLLIPKDKVAPRQPSKFRGVRLSERIRLPLAFIRREDSPKLRLGHPGAVIPASAGIRLEQTTGDLQATEQVWSRLDTVQLTGHAITRRGRRYLETREDGLYLEDDARAAVVAEEPPRGFELANGEKWIDVNIFRGTLVAYEGHRAVFASLISPGAQGYKRNPDGTNAKYTTPTGTFRMEWKHRSTTMSPDPERPSYSLAEVPWTQFFHMPFALHAAYWHDRFGEPKSGGCVNLSVADAKWLFDWTEPKLPDGWHGVRTGAEFGAGTWVRVR